MAGRRVLPTTLAVLALANCWGCNNPRREPVPRMLAPKDETTVPVPPPPTTEADPENLSVRALVERAENKNARLDSFVARLRRVESANGRNKPEEVLHFKFRREPLSIHFVWIGEEGHGREVLWVENKNDGKLQLRLARGDIPLMPAGKRMSMSPDSPLVRAQNPHHISEAGFSTTLRMLRGKLSLEQQQPERNIIKPLGLVKRKEYPYPLAGLRVQRDPGDDPVIPNGGTSEIYFDTNPSSPSYGLPVLGELTDPQGRLVEYTCLDRILYPIRLDDSDFDPDRLWGK